MNDITLDRPRPLSELRGIAAMLNDLHDGDAALSADERLSLALEIIAGSAQQVDIELRQVAFPALSQVRRERLAQLVARLLRVG